jgi:hypothetical protein
MHHPLIPKRKKRLKKLIAHLEEVQKRDPESFDLSFWIRGTDGKALLDAVDTWLDRWKKGETLNCGTAACVVGHLPLAFPRSFRWRRPQRNSPITNVSRCDAMAAALDDLKASAMLAEFFGGTWQDWDNVIYERKYGDGPRVRVSQVIARLYSLLRKLELEYSQVRYQERMEEKRLKEEANAH